MPLVVAGAIAKTVGGLLLVVFLAGFFFAWLLRR